MMFLQNIVKSRSYGTKAREKSVGEKLDHREYMTHFKN